MEKKNDKNMLNNSKDFFSRPTNWLCIGAIIILFLTVSVMFNSLNTFFKREDNAKYIYENGAKYLEIDDGYVINELVLESGSMLPSSRDYFNENYNLSDDIAIKYFNMDNVELNVDDFTVKVNENYFVKGIQDIIVSIFNNNKEYTASISIQDTTTPEVTIKDLTITEGDEFNAKDFIISYLDNSSIEDFTSSFVGDKHTEPGEYNVTIETCDMAKNCVNIDTKLIILAKIMEEPIIDNNSATSTKQSVGKKKNTNNNSNNSNNNNNGNTGNNNGNSNKDFDSNNITDETNAMKSTDPAFWELVSKAEDYLAADINQMRIYYVRDTFITKTNEARRAVGVPDLILDPTLCLLAQIRIFEYESIGWDDSATYVHKRPDLRDFSTIFKDYGYVAGVYEQTRHYGENSAAILDGPYYSNEGAFELLYHSGGHYFNMVAPFYRKMGIAHGVDPSNGKIFWIQLFSS